MLGTKSNLEACIEFVFTIFTLRMPATNFPGNFSFYVFIKNLAVSMLGLLQELNFILKARVFATSNLCQGVCRMDLAREVEVQNSIFRKGMEAFGSEERSVYMST